MDVVKNLLIVLLDINVLLCKLLCIYCECIFALIFGRRQKDVRDQVVAVTGGGQGFGKELSILLAERGAKIAVIDMNLKAAEEVADFISKTLETKAHAYHCDVRSPAQVKEVFDDIKQTMGPVDMLINNAGITHCIPLTALTEDMIENTFKVNTLAHFWTLKQVLPDMLSRRKGHIVAVASSAGLAGTGNLTDYCSSKFASVGLMRALEIELLDTGYSTDSEIFLTTVCPLMMNTGMFQACSSRFPFLFTNMDPSECAKRAVYGILTNEFLVVIPRTFEFFHRLMTLSPSKVGTSCQQFLGYRIHRHDKKD